jgi:hypothetical protein
MSTQATTGATKPFGQLIWKISAGALIPSLATVIFNALNFFFENYSKNPMPNLTVSVYDVGVGCAFSLVGVCVGSKDHAFTTAFLVIFVLLLLLILGSEVLVVFQHFSKFWMIWTTNAISFIALTYAIIEAE